MALTSHKTKIVCTIGPASEAVATLEEMIGAGMRVARLNFSHGSFEEHERRIESIRTAARNSGRRVAIMADLPGPKIRIGRLAEEPIDLEVGDDIVLTTADILGDRSKITVSFDPLPKVVKPGDYVFINDGIVQLEAQRSEGNEVFCKVAAGGELRSRKGVNLPTANLGISAFTDRDRECLEFALDQGVDAVSQSFVESAEDIHAVRSAAAERGRHPFIIAKVERARAWDNIDGILEASDGIMIARGDLGVEIPIEQIAVVQKKLIRMANVAGKPVITATQMLESMTEQRLPTRAESTDVANAILDGTDCVMLSAESAMGRYPVESVRMLARIAAATERERSAPRLIPLVDETTQECGRDAEDLVAASVASTVKQVCPAAVIAPTKSGKSARMVSRFRLPIWIAAVTRYEKTCQDLQFSYGVHTVHLDDHPTEWNDFAKEWVSANSLEGDLAILTAGPSSKNPHANLRMELIDLKGSWPIEK